jgi:adenine-specific DNA-methyltransferase
MKYMGSKRWMLENGLGHLLRDEVPSGRRFVDLFTGSGAVASFVSQKIEIPVQAFDIQEFCVVLARTTISRVRKIDGSDLWMEWQNRAVKLLKSKKRHTASTAEVVPLRDFTQAVVYEERARCKDERDFPLVRAYGGHYFSYAQALWLDALRACLPTNPTHRDTALAALIQAASQCAAAPGHTAQPFQPTRSAKPFVHEGWRKDIPSRTKSALVFLSSQHAKHKGSATVADANEAAKLVNDEDVVFVDPPYSGVHYSRFYHVLETIARGTSSEVSGVGRYPPPSERPRSKYSLRSEAREAISDLLQSVAEKGATAIVTFPDKKCSNGISSYLLRKISSEHFRKVEQKVVRGRFSTLGGDGEHRDARQPSAELVLILRP